MIIINLKGGLGNQLFEYALYTKLQMQNKKVELDTIQIKSDMEEINRGTIFEAFKLDGKYRIESLEKNVVRKKIKRKLCKYIFGYYQEKYVGTFDETIVNLKNGYLDGYWQTYKYFDDIREIILDRFEFLNTLEGANREFLKHINSQECAVSVHIRLGDYLANPSMRKLYGEICTEKYYKRAIEVIKEKYANPTFYVFSNESDKVSEIIPDENYVLIDCNDERAAWADMMLMSSCKHNIIANSSFSWWGAYLNRYEGRTVVAPKHFINGLDMPDICPDEWIRI